MAAALAEDACGARCILIARSEPAGYPRKGVLLEAGVPLAEGDEGFAVRDELIGLVITCGAVEVKENVRLP